MPKAGGPVTVQMSFTVIGDWPVIHLAPVFKRNEGATAF